MSRNHSNRACLETTRITNVSKRPETFYNLESTRDHPQREIHNLQHPPLIESAEESARRLAPPSPPWIQSPLECRRWTCTSERKRRQASSVLPFVFKFRTVSSDMVWISTIVAAPYRLLLSAVSRRQVCNSFNSFATFSFLVSSLGSFKA